MLDVHRTAATAPPTRKTPPTAMAIHRSRDFFSSSTDIAEPAIVGPSARLSPSRRDDGVSRTTRDSASGLADNRGGEEEPLAEAAGRDEGLAMNAGAADAWGRSEIPRRDIGRSELARVTIADSGSVAFIA